MHADSANIVQPVLKGVAKVPVILQLEDLECGAACLAMILGYYNKWIPIEQVRVDCGVSRDGSKALNIVEAARNYGLEAKGYRYEPEMLREKASFPCILHWNFNHFVVLCGFKGKRAIINDPEKGRQSISMEEFDLAFTGICLMFSPSASFRPGGQRKSTLAYVRKYLDGAAPAVALVVLTTIISCLFEIINPAFSRFFMDRLLTGQNRSLLRPFILLLSAAGILQVLVCAIRSACSLRLNAKMDIVGSSSFLWKILRMPVEFFSQRHAGDIMERQDTTAAIAATIIDTVVPVGFNLIMMLVYLLVMLRYSVLITLVGVTVVFINISITKLISDRRATLTRVQKRNQSKLNSTTVSGIRMIETIKATGGENGFFQRWSGYEAACNTHMVKYAKIREFMAVISPLMTSMANASVLIIGVWLTIQGQFTIGMIMSFQGLMNSFMTPANRLADSAQEFQEMRADMERIDDVMEYPNDPLFRDTPVLDDKDYSKLRGEVELKNVSFGYTRLEQPLIENFSMHVRPGSHVAIVGASGSGKSTLSRLISGLYLPWSGEILFDGRPIPEIERSVFTGSVALVEQEIVLFEDTIENNIKLWNRYIEDFEMILAARDAQIYDDIMAREGGFESVLYEGGRDLSGGQRQRIEIARALAQDPSVIILDEATSALDARTEYELVRAIRERGITCIVIAHRLSTIRDCDEIIVLDHGKVAERGTHEELYAAGGVYAEMISSD